jgi:hypothetical protein
LTKADQGNRNCAGQGGMDSQTFAGGGKANPGYQAIYRLVQRHHHDLSWRIYHSQGSNNMTGYDQPGGYQLGWTSCLAMLWS